MSDKGLTIESLYIIEDRRSAAFYVEGDTRDGKDGCPFIRNFETLHWSLN